MKKRNVSLDILKIIVTIGIIIVHYINKKFGGALTTQIPLNQNIIKTLYGLFLCSVNTFVLISGYYLIDDDKIKVRKIIDIIIMILFYGTLIYVFALIGGIIPGGKSSLQTLFKSITNVWFINIYLAMYILHPYFNKLLKSLNKKQHMNLIIILIFFFSIWPSLSYLMPKWFTIVMVKDYGYGIINFSILYSISAYIKLYKDEYRAGIFSILIAIAMLVITAVTRVYNYNYFPIIYMSVLIFILFKNITIKKPKKIIYYLSSCSLAVYLIHAHTATVKWMYQSLFKSTLYLKSNYLILHLFLTCIIIFVCCVIIELIRRLLFKYTVDKLLDKSKKINKVCKF